jgi:hypothetical protein
MNRTKRAMLRGTWMARGLAVSVLAVCAFLCGAHGAGAQAAGAAAATQDAAVQSATTAAQTDPAAAQAAAEAGSEVHSLGNDVTVKLSANWTAAAPKEMPPPDELRAYSPPFHLIAVLQLQNARTDSILQLTTSDNPLMGHDSNWLDEEMHKPAGSGMSVLDVLYYYFFPPNKGCMDEAFNGVKQATFAPSPAAASAAASGAPTIPSGNSTDPQMQLTFHCRHTPTLDGFYEAQLSTGITLVQTNNGPRAYANVPQFYLAPMERVASQGITWYVFEAQRTDAVSSNAMTRYGLPATLNGAQTDYFWAIGSSDPFPWTYDGRHASTTLIHVAYAGVGVGGNKRANFMNILQRVQVKAAQ